jgi:SAM-dependent methyltransferase
MDSASRCSVGGAMKEAEIRDRDAHARYLELASRDAESLASDPSVWELVTCPVCAGHGERESFVKAGFRYQVCSDCDTLYANPRPHYAALERIYRESESSRFWVEEFFKPVAEARRVKIFRPRAHFIADTFPELSSGRVADVGAGFGLFLEELRKAWAGAQLVAIEPSPEMARLCREKELRVLETMLEGAGDAEPPFDLITAFELFEHLHDPLAFLTQVKRLLKPNGVFLFTTLSGLGFDIQVLWERSRSIAPPHHLNFPNPFTINRLLKRAGMHLVSVETPGELDLDIVANATSEDTSLRFWPVVGSYVSHEGKSHFQEWLRNNSLSSHMRVIARA